MPEISRQITSQAQQDGIDQLFLEDPILFSQLLLDGRVAQFKEAEKQEAPILFYDRGLPDVTAYMDYLGTAYSDTFAETCRQYKYDHIFLLPPWEEIYEQDNERYESFDQAIRIHEFLKQGYETYDYVVHDLPVGTLTARTNEIMLQLNQLF